MVMSFFICRYINKYTSQRPTNFAQTQSAYCMSLEASVCLSTVQAQLLRVSINIMASEYDKISAHFYCVNYRSVNRILLTSFFDADHPY